MAGDRTPFHNPFGVLRPLTGEVQPREVLPEPEPPAHVRPPARAVVRLERAGRSGKDVTAIEHLDLPEPERAAWLKGLKTSLGCGGTIEGDRLVLQGDHRERAKLWLTDRGVRKVTLG